MEKLNPYQQQALKGKFHEEAKRVMDGKNDAYSRMYSIEMLCALHDMAKANVYPDGTFSDLDCNVWSLFRR